MFRVDSVEVMTICAAHPLLFMPHVTLNTELFYKAFYRDLFMKNTIHSAWHDNSHNLTKRPNIPVCCLMKRQQKHGEGDLMPSK